MRWQRKISLEKRIGEKRIIEKFLFLPLNLSNDRGQQECRWLEKTRIHQRLYRVVRYDGYDGYDGYETFKWINISWEDESNAENFIRKI